MWLLMAFVQSFLIIYNHLFLKQTGFFRCGEEWYHFQQELMVSKMIVKLSS